MAAEVVEEDIRHDPKFINFLFTLKRYECNFIVGTKELQKPEIIGVVPVMLMAHSEVLQSEMFCREVEDKKCVRVDDMAPDTFRNLLRYVYGYDNTGTLSFDEANNLFYAADKYLIDSLTSRLVNRLLKMLNPDNISNLLNNPACYRQLELDSAITQILQLETKRVLDSPQFLELTSDALVKVFEQELIAVKEIEVWRAAVKWAKQQTKSDNGQDLRKALEGPAKHIRVCTIDDDSLVNEVFPTGILTAEELNMVFLSKIKKEIQNDLVTFSNEIDHRVKNLQLPTSNQIVVTSQLDFVDHSEKCKLNESSLDIFTGDSAIELLPFNFTRAEDTSTNEELKCTITITKITDDTTNTTTEPPQIIEACNVPNGKEFSVAVAKEGKNIVLLPNSKYSVSVVFNKLIQMYWSEDTQSYEDENIKVELSKDPVGCYNIPLQSLFYRASPSGILTAEELNMVFLSKIKKEKQNDLVTFSNEIDHQVKNLQLPTSNQIVATSQLDFVDHSEKCKLNESSLDIFTGDCAIELLPFNFTRAKGTSSNKELKCTITITKITDDTTNPTTEPPQIIEACNLPNGKEFSVAVAKEGKNIVLLPDSWYHVSVVFNKRILMYCSEDTRSYEDENIEVELSEDPEGYYDIPLQSLFYRASITPMSSNNSQNPHVMTEDYKDT